MAECTHAGACLGPLAEPKVVELALEAGKLVVLEVTWQHVRFHASDVVHLEESATQRPREDVGGLGVEDTVEHTEELGRLGERWLHGYDAAGGGCRVEK